MGVHTGGQGTAAGGDTKGGTPMPHPRSGRALSLPVGLGAALALVVGCAARPEQAGHSTATRGADAPSSFPVTVTAAPPTTVIGIVLPAPPGVITDDAQTVTEQLDEAMRELLIDFTGAAASTAPATCQVYGIQPHTDQYAVAATVTNTDGAASTYRLTYELSAPDGTSLGTDFSVVSAVAPGTTVRDDTLGYLSDPVPWDQVTCTVTEVLRLDAA